MSYSFAVRAATKAAAMQAARAEMDKVIATQPVHAKDVNQALANIENLLGLVEEHHPDKDVVINANGYLSWTGVLGMEQPATFTGASCAASVNIVPRV